MTNFEVFRLLGIPQKLKAARVNIITGNEEREVDIGMVNAIAEYFKAEPAASAVNYRACFYDQCGWNVTRYVGQLTIKRNGNFTFMPD
jgi:hypothetical protein